MKNKIILHIPHSSLKLTKEFKNFQKHISNNEINKFNLTMTDLFTDKLFSYNKFKFIKANYSRICCDVEKFIDDNQEEMSKYGMGVIYTRTNKMQNLITINKEYKEIVLKKYYFPHHNKLNNIVEKSLKKNKSVILIDCHSFGKEIVMNGKTHDLPDVCIGYNEWSKGGLTLVNITNKYFQKLGYKTAINYPYVGSIIPNKLIKEPNKNFASIMLELNKDLYLDRTKKSKGFSKLKKRFAKLLKLHKEY